MPLNIALTKKKLRLLQEGKEILSDLRLSGFADPPLDEYKKWVDHLSNAARAAPKTPAESPN